MSQPFESAPPPPAGSYSSGPSGPRSGFWRRAAALILDGLVLLIPNIIITIALRHSPAGREALTLVLSLAYGTYFEGGARGQTVGKMALGIRVYDFGQGGSIGYGRALLRNVVKIFSGLVFFLGYLWMLWDKENQCWQDKAANDVVVPVAAYS